MNLPNLLTVMRFFLTCIFIVFVQQGSAGAGWALFVFAMAMATDFMDGYIARTYDLVTSFGKIMDPVADKFLTLAAFFMLAFEGIFPLWMAGVIALREMLVTASRIQYMTRGQIVAAEKSGKIKTVVQMGAIVAALAYRMMPEGAPDSFLKFYWQGMISLLIIAAVILTIWSGIEYFRHLPKEGEP